MTTAAVHPRSRLFMIGLLGVAAALITVGVLANLHLSLGISDRFAFFALFLVGMTMCALGPLGQGQRYGWGNPRHIVGYVLGVLILVLGAAMLFGLPLPWILDARMALVTLAVLMLIKVGAAAFYPRRR
jgi:hypothetical protein